MKNIILIGMPGTGKSVVGRALARRLGYTFLDVDDRIVEQAGMTLPEILRTQGLEAFLEIEGRVGQALECENTVIATGGSMVLSQPAMEHLRENGVTVWLETPLSQICDRYIKHPSEVLKVGDIVKVKVLDVDLKRKRISLTMKGLGNQTR